MRRPPTVEAVRGPLLALCTALACSCASGPHAEPTESAPIAMELTTPEGEPLELARMRGRPVLLFVFTTFDEACQLALMPLSRFAVERPELSVLGIAAQPNPARLLQLYATTLDVPFPLAYDAQDRIVAGSSPLGRVDVVPAYVLLDATGRVVGRLSGAASRAQLDELTNALP